MNSTIIHLFSVRFDAESRFQCGQYYLDVSLQSIHFEDFTLTVPTGLLERLCISTLKSPQTITSIISIGNEGRASSFIPVLQRPNFTHYSLLIADMQINPTIFTTPSNRWTKITKQNPENTHRCRRQTPEAKSAKQSPNKEQNPPSNKLLIIPLQILLSDRRELMVEPSHPFLQTQIIQFEGSNI